MIYNQIKSSQVKAKCSKPLVKGQKVLVFSTQSFLTDFINNLVVLFPYSFVFQCSNSKKQSRNCFLPLSIPIEVSLGPDPEESYLDTLCPH